MRRRSHHDHTRAAELARLAPGRWHLVGTYLSGYVAKSMVSRVHSGDIAAYSPAGVFASKTAPVADEVGLYVMYVPEEIRETPHEQSSDYAPYGGDDLEPQRKAGTVDAGNE